MSDTNNEIRRRLMQLLNENNLPGSKRESIETPGGSMTVPHPGPFQPTPAVTGGGSVARSLERLLSFAPSLRGRMSSVDVSQLDPGVNAESQTNRLGLLSAAPRRVVLSPEMLQMEEDGGELGSLAHEAYHSASRRNVHDDAYEVGSLIHSLPRRSL